MNNIYEGFNAYKTSLPISKLVNQKIKAQLKEEAKELRLIRANE